MSAVTAMILAGGRGKRMDIFCENRPKPVRPFAGKYRVIDMTLNNCVQSQIGSLAVLVDYQRTLMAEYLKEWNSGHPETRPAAVLHPRSASYSGTADAVFQNLEYLENQNSDTVLILAGDHIYNLDYRRMLAFHAAMQADVTVAFTPVSLREAHRFGVVKVADHRITDFVEKSSTPTSNLASMGIYVFNRRFLIEKLKEDNCNPNSPHDFGYSILPKLVKQDRVFGFEFGDYWQDIGTVESYYQANLQLLAGRAAFGQEEMRPDFYLPGSLSAVPLNVSGYIVNSLVSPGCAIEGYVENSILSPGVRVGEKARVVNSIVMAGTHIGDHSIVEKCIIDEEVNIDRFCHLGFGNADLPRVDEITLVGKQVRMGPNTSIGRRSKIMPGLSLTDLKYHFIAPGTVVSNPI